MRCLVISMLGMALAGCTAPPGKDDVAPADPAVWSFAAQAEALRAISCPDRAAGIPWDDMAIAVRQVDKGPVSAYADRLAGTDFVGAWELVSQHPGFGGLSGLALQPSGSLLSVSDRGAFIHIGIDPQTGAPDGSGAIAYMQDMDGNYLSGKRFADSEGLSLREGLALVSFEHFHRISAFDLEGCGAAARAAPLAVIPKRVEGRKIGDNRGAEALYLKGDRLHIGFEHRIDGHALLGQLNDDDSIAVTERRLPQSSYLLTGADHDSQTGLTAYLYRWYLPSMGTRIMVELEGPHVQRRFTLAAPMPVDNFEGIAIGRNPAGQVRLWLISDNNFNLQSQRTLLFAFDL